MQFDGLINLRHFFVGQSADECFKAGFVRCSNLIGHHFAEPIVYRHDRLRRIDSAGVARQGQNCNPPHMIVTDVSADDDGRAGFPDFAAR